MKNLIKSIIILISIVILLNSCALFEKEFILPLPSAKPATHITSIGFTAHWQKVTGAISYEIDIALDPQFTQFAKNHEARKTESNSIVISNLNASTRYYYRVRAIISNQTSKNSNTIEVTTLNLTTPIAYPASKVNATNFIIHWGKSDTSTAYLIEVAKDELFKNLVTNYEQISVEKDTLLQVSNVAINQQYFYRIRVQNGESISGYSNVQSVFTSTLAVPETLSAANIKLTSFTARWTSIDEADSYYIDVALDPLFEQTLPNYNNLRVNTNSLGIVGLDANVAYFYRVRAAKASVMSNHSEVKQANTNNISPPTATEATQVSSEGFQANWGKETDAESYLVDVALDIDFKQILANYRGISTASDFFIISSLESGTTYYYRIRAQGLNATSNHSNIIAITTNTLTAPVATIASEKKVFSFTANWQASTTTSVTYLLDVATDASFTNFVAGYQNKKVVGISQIVEELDFKTTYYYRVRTQRLNKVSGYSNTITVNPCIGSDCHLEEVDFFGNLEGEIKANDRDQTYTYNQGRLEVIAYTATALQGEKLTVSYQTDGAIQEVTRYSNNTIVRIYTYTYNNKLLERIDEKTPEGNIEEIWSFTNNAQGQRTSWVIRRTSDNTIKHYFNYIWNNKGQVTEIRDEHNAVLRTFTYSTQMNPSALLPNDLCFFISSASTWQWTSDAPRNQPQGNEYMGFIPTQTISKEEVNGNVYVYLIGESNAKGIVTNIQGPPNIRKVKFSTGCGF